MSGKGAEKYRTSVPSLSEVLVDSDSDAAVVTIKETKDTTFSGSGGRPDRLVLVIISDEYPENPYFPSTGKGGGVDRLYAKLGENQKTWPGERIALVRVRDVFNPTTKEHADKFHVAPPDEWDDIFAAFDKSARKTRRVTPTAKKRGR